MNNISKSNADKLGLDNVLWQTQEECAELIKAISKYNRVRGIGQKTKTSMEKAMSNLIEETADVSICIEQLMYLLNIENDVNLYRNEALEKVRKRYQD